MKKFVSVLLCLVVTLLSCVAFSSATDAEQGGTFSAFNFNVAGLPDFSSFIGGEPKDVRSFQGAAGKYINEKAYDIVAVQEDFSFHGTLTAELKNYKYFTQHRGGIPFGNGTGIFTKDSPLYNEKHITWNSLYGILDNGADEFSQKGITYCCIEIAAGVYADFYNVHADANEDANSLAARADNYRQLAQLINSREINRPVIVTGDLNDYLHNGYADLRGLLLDACGLKDAWVEVCNNGNYTDFTEFEQKYGGNKWGVWDSVERFLYKSGDGVELSCTAFEYVVVTNEKGERCSDHNAASAVFEYTVTDASKLTDSGIKVVRHCAVTEYFRRAVKLLEAIGLALGNASTIKAFLSGK